MLTRASVLCLVATSGVFAVARAQDEPRVELDVVGSSNAGTRCFDAAALQQRIAHYGAERLAKANELHLELHVETPDSAELRVFRGGRLIARRRFEQLPASCSDRRDAVALSIAMALEGVIHELSPVREPNAIPATDSTATAGETRALDARPDASTHESTARRELQAEASKGETAARQERTATAIATDAVDDPATSTSRGGPVRAQLHFGGRWLAHALPSPVWTGGLGAELWFTPRAAIDMSAFTSTIGDSTLAGSRAETRLTGGELLGCTAVKFGAVVAEGCLGAAAAACRASGRGYPIGYPGATLLWAAGAARFALRWPEEHPVFLRLIVQGHVNVVRPELRVYGSNDQLNPAWLGASVGLDVIVALE